MPITWFVFKIYNVVSTLTTLKYLCINHRDQWVFFNLWIIMNVLASSLRFIWISLLWVYGHYNFFNSFSQGTVFRRQILTSKDAPELTGLNAITELKGFNNKRLLYLLGKCKKNIWISIRLYVNEICHVSSDCGEHCSTITRSRKDLLSIPARTM